MKFSLRISFYIILQLVFLHGLTSNNNFNSDSLNALIKASKYKKAQEYLASIEDSILKLPDSTKINWLLIYGNVSVNALETDEGFEKTQLAVNIAERSNSKDLIFKSKIQLLDLFRNVRFYEKAIDLSRELRGQVSEMKPYELARYYHRSAAIYNELNYINKNNKFLDTAIVFSKNSINISLPNNFKNHLATSYNELGNIFEKKGNYRESKIYYDKSIELWKNENLFNYANATKNKGSYFLRTNQLDSSILYFHRGLSLTKSLHDPRFNMETYWGLKHSYYKKGDSLNGLKAELKEAANKKIETENQLNNKLFELNIAYEASKKDKQLSIQNRKIAVDEKRYLFILTVSIFLVFIITFLIFVYFYTKKKNIKLQYLLRENEFLVGESNHRIKNNLQLIISLIGREIYKEKNNQFALTEISEKINSIATLHQQLYLHKTKEEIEVKKYVEEILQNFKSHLQSRKVETEIDLGFFSLDIDKAVYVGLLVTELLTNSLKHAFKNDSNNKLTIDIHTEGNDIHFIYKDNGEGLKNNENPALVNLLVKQLKSESFLENSTGYTLKIKFKK